MARNYWLISFFILFAIFFTQAQSILHYNLSIGDSIFVKQEATQDITQDIEGSKHEMKNNMEGDFTFIVTSKTDSSYIFQFQFTRFKLESSSNLYGTLLNVDTSHKVEDEDIQNKIFSGITSTPLTMEMLKNGKVISIKNTDELINKMIANANITNEFSRQLMIESMKNEFGAENLSRSMEQMTFIYCNKPVNIGDSWTNNYKGKLKAKNTWILEKIDSTMVLRANSTIEMQTKESNLTMQLKGTQNTQINANKTTCLAKNMTVNSFSKGITVMEQMKNIEIPTTIKSVTTYKIKHHVQ